MVSTEINILCSSINCLNMMIDQTREFRAYTFLWLPAVWPWLSALDYLTFPWRPILSTRNNWLLTTEIATAPYFSILNALMSEVSLATNFFFPSCRIRGLSTVMRTMWWSLSVVLNQLNSPSLKAVPHCWAKNYFQSTNLKKSCWKI